MIPRLPGHENAGSGRALFDRLNNLVDSGLAADLSGPELRVLLVFLRHADANGVAWPGPDSIAAKLRMNERNVRRAIASLVGRRILSAGTPGRNGFAKRSITIPKAQENRAQGAPFSPESKGAQDGKETGRTVVEKGGANEQENRAPCAPLSTHEQPSEQPNNNTHGCAGGAGGVLLGWMNAEEAHKAIARHGAEHCARVLALVEVQRGETRRPKRLLAHLLAQDAADVDFKPLEDHEEAQEYERHLEERAARERELQGDTDRRFNEAREIIAAVPNADRDAWRRVAALRFNGYSFKDNKDIAGAIGFAALIRKTPDVNELLKALENGTYVDQDEENFYAEILNDLKERVTA